MEAGLGVLKCVFYFQWHGFSPETSSTGQAASSPSDGLWALWWIGSNPELVFSSSWLLGE